MNTSKVTELRLLLKEKLKNIDQQGKSLNSYGVGKLNIIGTYFLYFQEEDFGHVKQLIDALDTEQNVSSNEND